MGIYSAVKHRISIEVYKRMKGIQIEMKDVFDRESYNFKSSEATKEAFKPTGCFNLEFVRATTHEKEKKINKTSYVLSIDNLF